MWLTLRVIWVTSAMLLVTLLLLPFHLFAIILKDPARQYSPYLWHKIACWLLGIQIKRKGKLLKQRPLMIAANHSSWLDIVVLGATTPLVFIAKSDVKDWPIFGALAKLQRTVFIERNRRNQTGKQVSTIARRMQKGDVVVLFPEGTTSDGNYVLPFKSALFGAAERAQAGIESHELTIQPISIAYVSAHGVPLGRGNRDLASWPGDVALMPHLLNIIKEGSLGVEITFAEPIIFTEDMSRSEIAKLCEARVRKGLNQSLRI